jgi:hypothetical protein
MKAAILRAAVFLGLACALGPWADQAVAFSPVHRPWLGSGLETLNETCPRFAGMIITKMAGLGHRFGELIFGMQLAQLLNVTFVLDEALWHATGDHGKFRFFSEFLPLHRTELTLTNLHRRFPKVSRKILPWKDALEMARKDREAGHCHTYYLVGYGTCVSDQSIRDESAVRNKPHGCFHTQIGSYEQVKWRLRLLYHQHATYRPQFSDRQILEALLSSPTSSPAIKHPHTIPDTPSSSSTTHFSAEDCVMVVWHIRLGDITLLTKKSFYEKVSEQVATALHPLPCCVVFLSIRPDRPHGVTANATTVNLLGSPPRFSFLEEVCATHFGGRCAFPMLSTADSLFHMIHSDLLITSGSSFSIVAAELRLRGGVLEPLSKEGVRGIFETSESALLDGNGDLISTSLLELSAVVRLAFYDRIDEWSRPEKDVFHAR